MLIPKYFNENPQFVDCNYVFLDGKRVQGRLFRGIFAYRSTGKTHTTLEYINTRLESEPDAVAFCLRRKQTELTPDSIEAIVTKLNGIYNTDEFRRQGRKVYKKDRWFLIFDCLSGYARIKYDNYDNPFVNIIWFDEVFSYTPLKQEAFKLDSIIKSVGRKIGSSYSDIDIILTGNHTHGVSEIVNDIGVKLLGTKQEKFSGDGFRILTSTIENVFEEKPYKVKPHKMNNKPFFFFIYQNNKYGLWFSEYFTYIYFAEYSGTGKPINDYEFIKFLNMMVKNDYSILHADIFIDKDTSMPALMSTGIFNVLKVVY